MQHMTTMRRQRITPSAPPQGPHRRVHHHPYCTYPSQHAHTAPPPPCPRLDKCREAAEVRKRWLPAHLFARRTAPREAAIFAARQLLAMPDPLRAGLATAHGSQLFAQITGHDAGHWLETCDTAAGNRLPLLILAPIVTAYELAMSGGEGRNTWRPGRYSPCPRDQAGRYFAFLASVGYQLSGIEQAVADGVTWTGDTPPGDPLTGPAETGSAGVSHAGEPQPAGEPLPGDEPAPRGEHATGQETRTGDLDSEAAGDSRTTTAAARA
jgi:hypothetical protein